GNAITRASQRGTIEEQGLNVKETLRNILYLIKDGYKLVITHGNGPQVGNILMRNDAGEQLYGITQMPLDICVADSQGGIGYLIERVLRNLLKEEGIEKDILTLVTQVLVDKNDPAFANPTKRIGKSYTKEEAEFLKKEKNWTFKETPKMPGYYRRVVPSPTPIAIYNRESIRKLALHGSIIIAVGGGGIPIYQDKDGCIHGIEAVIDKDRASSLLAQKIGADELYILTDIPYIYLDFNKPTERIVEFLSLDEAKEYLKQGQFGEGSMAPKIQAAIDFVENGGKKTIITEATKLNDKKYGSKITKFK
ncbi:MAG TPA: carbamate kinase, partial [Bacteroidetes bacterium]|nr:carbamate kinase [Bacteroidota bacterium]